MSYNTYNNKLIIKGFKHVFFSYWEIGAVIKVLLLVKPHHCTQSLYLHNNPNICAWFFLTIKIRLFKGHPVGDLKATGQDGSATLLDAIKLHFKL